MLPVYPVCTLPNPLPHAARGGEGIKREVCNNAALRTVSVRSRIKIVLDFAHSFYHFLPDFFKPRATIIAFVISRTMVRTICLNKVFFDSESIVDVSFIEGLF